MSRFAGRKLDQFWFWFCVSHLFISTLLDLQPLYPAHWLAGTPLPEVFEWSIALTRDPILTAASSPDKGGPAFLWLRCYVYLEAFFQVPCFIIGAIALWRNDKRVYPLLLAYGASTATTLLPCLGSILTATPEPPFTQMETFNLLAEYVPFLVLPTLLALDMGSRIVEIVSAAEGRKRV